MGTTTTTKNRVAYSMDGTQVIDEMVARSRAGSNTGGHATGTGAGQKGGLSLSRVASRRGMGSAEIRPIWEQKEDVEKIPNPILRSPKTVTVIGAPISWGQPLAGTDSGPKMIRDAGLMQALKKMGWRIDDKGDVDTSAPTEEEFKQDEAYVRKSGANVRNSSALGRMLHTLAMQTEAAARRRDFCLAVGGDHSISLGSLAGILAVRPDTGVIWVDAHADLNTPHTSETGNVHGMPVGMLMAPDEYRTQVPGFKWLRGMPRLAPEKLVYIGARDLDPAERREIRAKNIKCFTMHEVDRYGIGEVVRRAIDHLGPTTPLHLSYDIDAVDPDVAPATGTVVRGGFNFREAHYIAEAVAETDRLASMDMVEINPTLKPNTAGAGDATVELGLALVASALGARIL